MFLIFLCFISSLFAAEKQMELFVYWSPEAKGQEAFEGDVSLPSKIRNRMLQKGWDISSWAPDFYRPWLVGWKGVHSWQEFKWRLGFGLPKIPEKDFWVFWSLGLSVRDFDFGRAPKEKLVLFIWEPPVAQKEGYDPKIWDQFGKIFTWDDDLVDGKKFFKFYYPVMHPRIANIPSFDEKKFCTLISSRLSSKHPKEIYSEREKTIRFFEDKPGEFDLYGRHWEKRKFKNYRGTVGDKIEVMKNYKFCICYENTKDIRGYITEKIFDCFTAGCVPVYWGASNVTEYIPEGAFIDRRKFKDEQELYDFLKSVSEQEYEQYLEKAGKFLQSEMAKRFTDEQFVQDFMKILE